MRIGKFKSLYTNIDPNDVKLEYLSKASNVRLRDKATETKFYDWTNIQLPEGIIEVLLYRAIELDNDKFQSDVNSSGKPYPTYQYSIEQDHLLIGNTATETQIWLFVPNQDPKLMSVPSIGLYSKANIFSDNGHILILLDTDTLWLGKLDRNLWINNAVASRTNGWYLDRYLEPFDINNQGVDEGSKVMQSGAIVPDPSFTVVKPNRRLGFGVTVDVITDQNTTINPLLVQFILLEMKNRRDGGSYIPKSPNADVRYYSVALELRSLDGNNTLINSPTGASYWLFDVLPIGGDIVQDPSAWPYDKITLVVPTGYFVELNSVPIVLQLSNGMTPNWYRVTSDYLTAGEPNGEYLLPKLSDLLDPNMFNYMGPSIGSFGFDAGDKNYEIVVTSILDHKEEMVTEYISGVAKIPSGIPRYGLQFNISIPYNVNKRLTGLAVYIRFSKLTDFYQIQSLNFLSSNELNNLSFLVASISANAIELVQTIGTLFNPDNFVLLTAFDYFNRVNSLPYMAKDNQVYGGVSGNGQILDLFYPSNAIPDITERKITAISNVNNIPAIHDIEKTTLILANNAGNGAIEYTKRDVIGFTIKNEYDIAVSPDGITVHTDHGIFAYNGNSLVPLSKEIDDIVQNNFSTGMIFYNDFTKDLYYITDSSFTQFYRHSFIDKSWTTHNLPVASPVTLKNISIDFDGNILVNLTDSLYKVHDSLKGTATITTQFSDLGKPRALKSFDSYRFDFIGTIVINGFGYTTQVRDQILIYIPINLRYPIEKISLSFDMIDDTKIFAIDLNEVTVAIDDNGIIKPYIVPIVPVILPEPIIKPPVVPPLPIAFAMYIPLVGNVTANTAEVVWATTLPGTSKIIYGPTPSTMTNIQTDSTMTMYHDMIITGLELESDYYAQVSSTDAAGDTVTSDVILFFTGKEITIQALISTPTTVLSKQAIDTTKSINVTIDQSDYDSTIVPDEDAGIELSTSTSTKTITITQSDSTTIGTNYDYTVI